MFLTIIATYSTISRAHRDCKMVICLKVFNRRGTQLLMSTAYHPQTDGLSERANQTEDVSLRYLITESPDSNWVAVMPALQLRLNKAFHGYNATGNFATNSKSFYDGANAIVSLLYQIVEILSQHAKLVRISRF